MCQDTKTCTEDQLFENIDYTVLPFPKADYEYCTFKSCAFENTDLSDTVFLECNFVNCNLSLVGITNTTFGNVTFEGCKMLGLRFDSCNKNIQIVFRNCILDYSSFCGMKLKGSMFGDSKLVEVNFTGADLTLASFAGSDLSGAVFNNTVIVSTDFSTARNFEIDPEQNKLLKAKFSSSDLIHLLTKHRLEIS